MNPEISERWFRTTTNSDESRDCSPANQSHVGVGLFGPLGPCAYPINSISGHSHILSRETVRPRCEYRYQQTKRLRSRLLSPAMPNPHSEY